MKKILLIILGVVATGCFAFFFKTSMLNSIAENWKYVVMFIIILLSVFFVLAEALGLFHNSSKNTILKFIKHKEISVILSLLVCIAIMTLVTNSSLEKLQTSLKDNCTKTDEIYSLVGVQPKEVFTTGTDGIYEEVKKEFTSRNDFSSKLEIDIIGYTMFSVEPKLKEWYEKGYLKNISINLIHLDKDFISKSEFINPVWQTRLTDHIGQIQSFIKTHTSEFTKDKVIIKFSSYKHIPGVHGFRFRNGRYFISFSTWDNEGKIKLPTDAQYFIVEKDDKRDHANAMKLIMDNWINTKLFK